MAAVISSRSQTIGADLNPEIYSRIEDPLKEHLNQDNKITTLVMRCLFGPEVFGKDAWFYWFGVDVEAEPEITKEFILFCYENRARLLHIPVLRPQYVDKQPFTLERLGHMVQHPKNSEHVARKSLDNSALRQHEKTPAGPICWLVPVEGPGVDSETYSKKMTTEGFETKPPIIDLATIIFTRYVATGLVKIAQEGHWVTAHCQEKEAINEVQDDSPSASLMEIADWQEDDWRMISFVPRLKTNRASNPLPLAVSIIAPVGIALRQTCSATEKYDGILALRRF